MIKNTLLLSVDNAFLGVVVVTLIFVSTLRPSNVAHIILSTHFITVIMVLCDATVNGNSIGWMG